MNLKKLIFGAMPLFLLTACSNANDPDITGKTEQVDGYIALNLQLPTTKATRAINDQFENGESSEYDVHEGLLILFKGAPGVAESDVTYCGAYDLGFPTKPTEGPNTDPNNVTVAYRRTVKVSDITLEETERLYGLVVLNQRQAAIALTQTGLSVGDRVANTSTKFSDILGWTSERAFYAAENAKPATSIFMCSSPLSDTQSSAIQSLGTNKVKITTLVDLTDGLKGSAQEAAAYASIPMIYVERAVAKVTCSKFLGTEIGAGQETGITVEQGGAAAKLYVKDVEWAIGNEEAQSYYVRNTGKAGDIDWTLNTKNTSLAATTSSLYRMVGNSGLRKASDSSTESLYRPYWCIDPHYASDKLNPTNMREMKKWNSSDIFYTHENTFDVEHQSYKNTTRAGFWVTFGIGNGQAPQTFYTRGTNRSNIYVDNANGNPLQQYVLAELSTNEQVKTVWQNALKEGVSGTFSPAEQLNVQTSVSNAGLLSVTGITFKDNANLYTTTPTFDFTSLIAGFNQTYQFYEYTGGRAFYEVRIKHFGDELTPWPITRPVGDIAGAYPEPDRDNNYLGRYGMVRNNWYDLQINNLLSLGDPRDPAVWDAEWSERPDDNRDMYVSFSVAILSWAKRVQSVDF